MSQGSFCGHFVARTGAMSQVQIGHSGLPLVPCPRCGEQVLELKSWKHGGRIFFKCRKNEIEMPSRCGFFKWLEEYQEFLVESGFSQMDGRQSADIQALGGTVDMKMKGNGRVEERMDKLIKLVQLMVLSNVVIAVVVIFGVIVMLVK
ncbi:uncharacterized protein LOC133887667 [Phragmites australis]|uniref:uncharacterized protein LOC133887667 n=1 Tax=Phragmites australis TaxID=29695 RepID=UPI002D766C72|nr:uncharacterized protein LOC133887667 [Phragmites australis]